MRITDKITITREDNMELMARYPDGYFDWAIVDPPYGIKEDGHRDNHTRSKKAKSKKYHNELWNQNAPNSDYFDELFRVSKNQIIWGANHLADKFCAKSSCWIVWNKKVMSGKGNHFADAELAYCSLSSAVRTFEFEWQGMIQGDMKNKEERIHPTQKPVALYKWLLDKYTKSGNKILDTHLGSGSIAIACYDYGYDLTACELDKEYYELAVKRIKHHISFNQSLFQPEELIINQLFTDI
ncbi:DNA methyltransferase [Elizabethkingia anophelis]|uniref:DNA methyltransferase n=1 Tax=Elizabethkingia anophelis TaxID=1117645 RepID=UPI001315F173|nr:DNA methyltransferase [Elizabethkingia anophelis]BBQ07961.1 methyltransferase [Elizabethkingia anophelis]